MAAKTYCLLFGALFIIGKPSYITDPMSPSEEVATKICGCSITDQGISADCSSTPKIDVDCLVNLNLSPIYKLNLSNNSLLDFPEFLNRIEFKDVKILNISNNNITELPANVSSRFEELDASHNHLKALPILSGTSMKRLDVSQNHLTSLKYVVNSNISEINLQGNPFECECNNLTQTRIIYHRIVKGQLRGLSCIDNKSDELKPFTANPSCHKKIEVVTEEPDWKDSFLDNWRSLSFFIPLFVFVLIIICFLKKFK